MIGATLLTKVLLLSVTGLFAGLAGGLLGIGGSVIMIPVMTELLGPEQHLYQASAMIVNFFVVVPSVRQHLRARAINADLTRRLIPLAMVGVMAGVACSELSWFTGAGEARLRLAFGLFLMFICAYDLYRLVRRNAPPELNAETMRTSWGFAALVAAPTSFIGGLLGVGGGVLAVPLQRRILGVPIRIAIANSATMIIATSLVGAAMKNYALVTHHHYPVLAAPTLAAVLIPTAVIGASIGSRLTHRLPRRWVAAAFFLLMLVVALRLTYDAARDLPPAAEAHALLGAEPAPPPD